jgi:hypothetical protein
MFLVHNTAIKSSFFNLIFKHLMFVGPVMVQHYKSFLLLILVCVKKTPHPDLLRYGVWIVRGRLPSALPFASLKESYAHEPSLIRIEQRKTLKSRKNSFAPRMLRKYYATTATGSCLAVAA